MIFFNPVSVIPTFHRKCILFIYYFYQLCFFYYIYFIIKHWLLKFSCAYMYPPNLYFVFNVICVQCDRLIIY